MDFELRKVKVINEMSEETICFSAEIWENGKLMAYVSNHGHGGCNDVHPAKNLTYADVSKYDTLDMEAEIMERAIEIDEIKRHQSKGFFLKKGDTYYTRKFPMPISKLKKHRDFSTWLNKERMNIEKDGFTILNTNL